MPRSTIIFLLLLTVIASALGYNYFTRTKDDFRAVQTQQLETSTATDEQKNDLDSAEQFISDQDLAQLIALPYLLDGKKTSTQSAEIDWISQNQPGVVTLFGDRISTTSAKSTINKINSDFNDEQRPLIIVDHEGGLVQRLSGAGFTDLPSWKSVCALDTSSRQNILTTSAQEISQVGVEMVFAPVIDVASQSAIMKDRICSPDPETVTEMAAEFINIFAQQKIVSVIKHYPGIGSISRDLHLKFDEVDLGEAEIKVFKDLLDSYQLLGVMSAHVGVKNHYEGEPCSLNRDCIDDLTGHFPQALVFTDALDMESAGYASQSGEMVPLTERSVSAIKAGNDVLVYGPNVTLTELDEVLLALKTAYKSDESFRQQAEKSVAKIRQYKAILR